MFCNYCHTQSLQRKALRVQVESLLTRAKECLDTGSTADNVGVGDVYNINKGENEIKNSARGPNSWNGGRYSFTGPGIGTGTRQSSQHSEKITTISEEDEEDSLVSLFKIILTGTIPLKRNKIDLLLATYRIDEARLKQNYDGKTPTPVATTMISATSSASSSFTTGTPQSNKGDRGGSSFNNGTTRDIHIVRREKERTIEDEIVWCNGRCNGAANGPLCSAICMNLWAERVQQARKTISVKRAIARQHHSGSHLLNHITHEIFHIVAVHAYHFFLSFSPSLYLSISMSLSPSPSLSLSHSFTLSLSLSLLILLSVSQVLHPSVYLSVSLSIFPSISFFTLPLPLILYYCSPFLSSICRSCNE